MPLDEGKNLQPVASWDVTARVFTSVPCMEATVENAGELSHKGLAGSPNQIVHRLEFRLGFEILGSCSRCCDDLLQALRILAPCDEKQSHCLWCYSCIQRSHWVAIRRLAAASVV